jgi:hypothetical protein
MLRYYPSFKIIPNQSTLGGEFLLNGESYVGKYYITYDKRAFTGPSPEIGPNELLERDVAFAYKPGPDNPNVESILDELESENIEVHTKKTLSANPISYYPQPTDDDYKKGYIIRYFTKKENERGFVIEISQDEYNSIVNGTANYDIRLYQVTTILWKLTGPLNNTRKSQYNIIPGIIETNRRLTEAANKNFLGIVEFIGGDYTKFATPTM